MTVKVYYKKLNENAILPTRGTDYSAGSDLYSLPDAEICVPAGETVIIHTGIAVAIPEGYAGFIFARSGIALKRGLAPANKVGVIDSDYRGEIMVALHNHGKTDQTVAGGERVAQLVIMPYAAAEFELSDSLGDTGRGTGGFGSTGTK